MLSVSLLLMAVSLFAQKDITVSGTVRDEKGETLVGVNVVVKNQPGFGVVTDLDGKYTIKTQSNEVLIFSFVGYDKQEVAVSGCEKIDIVMKVTSEALEEVTVVGAGVQRKASVVGAITTVDVKTMKIVASMSSFRLSALDFSAGSWYRLGEDLFVFASRSVAAERGAFLSGGLLLAA